MESLSNANLERTLIKSFHFEFCILYSSEKYQELQSACKAIVPLIKLFFADVAVVVVAVVVVVVVIVVVVVVVVVCLGSLNFDLFSRTVSFSRNTIIKPSRT